MQLNTFVFIFFTLALHACGYHLRGGATLPKELNSVYLEGASAMLRDQCKELLDLSSGKLAPSPEKAGVSVRISNEDFNRRILSLSSRGRSNEVELDYRLEYDLIKSGKVLVADQSLRLRREYFNDQEDIIAKDNEENVIRKEMYQQAMHTILTRASSELQKKAH